MNYLIVIFKYLIRVFIGLDPYYQLTVAAGSGLVYCLAFIC